MGVKRKRRKKAGGVTDGSHRLTIFDQLEAVAWEWRQQIGLVPPTGMPKPRFKLPAWCRHIGHRFCGTIFKPALKLRPNGRVN